MIVPITKEDEWSRHLAGLPRFIPGNGPMVVLSPHPDDETLAAGGLIATEARLGRSVTVIAATDGEHAYEDSPSLAITRRREQCEALAVLAGARGRLVRLGLTDSGVANQECELIERLLPYVDADTHLVAPWPGDFHPDHEACGRAALAVARRTGARLSWFFFWTWHRGVPQTLESLSLRTFPLDASSVQIKARALACHQSQLTHPSGEPILPESLLGPMRRSFEVFAHS